MQAIYSSPILDSFSWLTMIGSLTIVTCIYLVGNSFFSTHRYLRLLPVADRAQLVWGHEKQVFMNEPGAAFREWTRRLGLAYRIKAAFSAPDILVLSDPVGIAYVMQKKIYDYHHSALVRPRIARLMGEGLGWVEGEREHKRMRRLTSPSLTSDNVKALSPDITESVVHLVNELVKLAHNQGNKTRVNLIDWTGKVTLNIIGQVAFLYDFKGGDSEEAQSILVARKKAVSPIAKYIGFLTLMLLRRFPFMNYLPIGAIQSQAGAKQAIQNSLAQKLVSRNKESLKETKSDGAKDLLTILVSAAAEEQISIEEVHSQISTFIIAGSESTTNTVAFAVWELARHPEKQRKLRKELVTLAGDPTMKDMQDNLPYLDAILKETLRLYPALPYMERVSTKNDVIPLRDPVKLSNGDITSEIVIEPGQTVIIPIIAIQRQDDIWKDPDVFRPERWLEDVPSSDLLCSGWEGLLAFSDGPRKCIGYRLAIFNFKIILASMATRFHFEEPKLNLSLKISSSLQPWVYEKIEDQSQNELPVVLRLIGDD